MTRLGALSKEQLKGLCKLISQYDNKYTQFKKNLLSIKNKSQKPPSLKSNSQKVQLYDKHNLSAYQFVKMVFFMLRQGFFGDQQSKCLDQQSYEKYKFNKLKQHLYFLRQRIKFSKLRFQQQKMPPFQQKQTNKDEYYLFNNGQIIKILQQIAQNVQNRLGQYFYSKLHQSLVENIENNTQRVQSLASLYDIIVYIQRHYPWYRWQKQQLQNYQKKKLKQSLSRQIKKKEYNELNFLQLQCISKLRQQINNIRKVNPHLQEFIKQQQKQFICKQQSKQRQKEQQVKHEQQKQQVKQETQEKRQQFSKSTADKIINISELKDLANRIGRRNRLISNKQKFRIEQMKLAMKGNNYGVMSRKEQFKDNQQRNRIKNRQILYYQKKKQQNKKLIGVVGKHRRMSQ